MSPKTSEFVPTIAMPNIALITKVVMISSSFKINIWKGKQNFKAITNIPLPPSRWTSPNPAMLYITGLITTCCNITRDHRGIGWCHMTLSRVRVFFLRIFFLQIIATSSPDSQWPDNTICQSCVRWWPRTPFWIKVSELHHNKYRVSGGVI